jgi:chloramphenicol 3-O-phosphotransferase
LQQEFNRVHSFSLSTKLLKEPLGIGIEIPGKLKKDILEAVTFYGCPLLELTQRAQRNELALMNDANTVTETLTPRLVRARKMSFARRALRGSRLAVGSSTKRICGL